MKSLQYSLLTLLLIVSTSFGEDRTGEFYALIEDRMWIEEVMRENYLWAEDMHVIEKEDDYFQAPATFFKNMLSKNALNGKGDKYSYMEEITVKSDKEARSLTIDRTSTYGMEFVLSSDPTGTTAHTLARVLYVLPNSPAQKAGIERGDWISAINEERITTDNYQQLIQGGIISLTRSQIINTENGLGWQVKDVINVDASISMEVNPFLVNKILEVDGQKIAYLVYNEFATGPNNEGTESVYDEQMKQIFAQFKAQSPDAFILDLRYNNGGFLQCAQALGSLLAPSTAMGKDFFSMTYNSQANPQIIRYPFDTQYADANLNLNKIYILTGKYTASASEVIINGLIPYMGAENVILVGTKTEGKNVAMKSFKNEIHGLILHPVIAYISNANNEGDYSEGFQPTYQLDENSINTWYPLGSPEEYLLKNTLSLITIGTLSDESTTDNGESKTIRSSIGYNGIRIQ